MLHSSALQAHVRPVAHRDGVRHGGLLRIELQTLIAGHRLNLCPRLEIGLPILKAPAHAVVSASIHLKVHAVEELTDMLFLVGCDHQYLRYFISLRLELVGIRLTPPSALSSRSLMAVSIACLRACSMPLGGVSWPA